ncbi:MAG TPA: hypothetical protein PLC59_04655 [Bacteroidales bacterium]|nr:hypothetical protein [Bacteroidales bacterium]HQI45324.1 hypothetical protein [Bacteroidales bacterium]
MKKSIELTPEEQSDIANLPQMSIAEIAALVNKYWLKVHFAAEPYLDAMYSLNSINDSYGYDSGKSIVLYFLSNASTWKGGVAREVKKELLKRCKS